jgi:hypothetical protein
MRLKSSSLKINLISAPENFIKVTNYGIQYPTTYNNTGQLLSQSSNYSQTFDGTTLTGTLVLVDASNVGLQFLITNTNGESLTITTTAGQLIYSSTGSASATSRSLSTGHSHIFTAIKTTGTTTYGWSMV